jgi:phosphoglycolate phosphatase
MLRRRPPSLIVFDLDGTLVDSAPDLAYAADSTLEQLGLPPAGESRVRGWIGKGVPMLVRRVLTGEMWPEGDPPRFAKALEIFQGRYQTNVCDRSRLYPGVAQGLAAVKAAGSPTAVLTNKASRFTIPLVDQLGISRHFDYVGSGDDFVRQKPHPEPLLKTAERFGVAPADCLMVGDSANDAQAARSAGYGFVAAPYGYHGGDGVAGFEPDALVESLADVPGLLSAAV